MNDHIHPVFTKILNDFSPKPVVNDFHLEHYGHRAFYLTHYCPTCEQSQKCPETLCRLPHEIECLPCATRDLLGDIERIAKEGRAFLNTTVPTDAQGLMWWKALRSKLDGKLQGLVTRSAEILSRKTA